jgi:hypothetical protein
VWELGRWPLMGTRGDEGVIWHRRETKSVWAGAGLNGLATWAGSRENGCGLAREIGVKQIWATDRNMNCFSN